MGTGKVDGRSTSSTRKPRSGTPTSPAPCSGHKSTPIWERQTDHRGIERTMESYEEKRAHALELANKRRRGGALAFLGHWAKIMVLSLALFVVVRAFGVEAFKIAGGSMEHTLFEGDFLLINKLVYGAGIPGSGRKLPALHAPRNGDVIVFTYPVDPRLNYVKRIVGVPGDTVSMRDGTLIRNGRPVQENYVQHTPEDADQSDD